MDFLGKIEDATKNVVVKGRDLTEIFQIEKEINALEKEVGNFKVLIGDYVLNKKLLEEDGQIATYVKEIMLRNESIQIKRGHILKLKNLKICPSCNFELPNDAKFCKNCGTKIEISEQVKMLGDVCCNCGSQITEGAKFCSKCGNKV